MITSISIVALKARVKAAELKISRSKLIDYLYLQSEELQAEVRKSLADSK